MKIFYRVCNPNSYQGLWYSYDGQFTGLLQTIYENGNFFNLVTLTEIKERISKTL